VGFGFGIDAHGGHDRGVASDVDAAAIEADGINGGHGGGVAAHGVGGHEVGVLNDGVDAAVAAQLEVERGDTRQILGREAGGIAQGAGGRGVEGTRGCAEDGAIAGAIQDNIVHTGDRRCEVVKTTGSNASEGITGDGFSIQGASDLGLTLEGADAADAGKVSCGAVHTVNGADIQATEADGAEVAVGRGVSSSAGG